MALETLGHLFSAGFVVIFHFSFRVSFFSRFSLSLHFLCIQLFFFFFFLQS